MSCLYIKLLACVYSAFMDGSRDADSERPMWFGTRQRIDVPSAFFFLGVEETSLERQIASQCVLTCMCLIEVSIDASAFFASDLHRPE